MVYWFEYKALQLFSIKTTSVRSGQASVVGGGAVWTTDILDILSGKGNGQGNKKQPPLLLPSTFLLNYHPRPLLLQLRPMNLTRKGHKSQYNMATPSILWSCTNPRWEFSLFQEKKLLTPLRIFLLGGSGQSIHQYHTPSIPRILIPSF